MPLRSCSGRLVTVPPHGTCSSRFATESRERRNRLLRISEMLPRKAGLVRFPPFFGQVFITTGCPERSASRSGTCTQSAGFSAAAGLSPTRPTAPRPPSGRGLLGCTHLFWPGPASHRCGSSARSGGLGLTGGGGLVHGRGMQAQLPGEAAKVRVEVGLLLPRAPPTWRTALHPNAGTAHTPARSQFQNTWSAYGKRGDSGTLLRASRRPLSAPQVTHSQSPALDAAASHSARQLPLAGARAPLTSFQAVRFLSKMAALVLLRLSTPAQEHDDLQG